MSNQAAQIVQEYFDALTSGQSEQIASFLSDDFKEIGSLPVPQSKASYLVSLSNGRGAVLADRTIRDIQALGNIVQVDYQRVGIEFAGDDESGSSVYALADGKIKLEVRVKPTALSFV